MTSRREEVLRRLGSPRHKYQCPCCRRYVPGLEMCWDWSKLGDQPPRPENALFLCSPCAAAQSQRNQAFERERMKNEWDYVRANADHRYYSKRPSNPGYRRACEQMRREVPEARWGGIFL